MKSYLFRIVVEEDRFADGRPGFSALCPGLEGAYTWGNTREEVLERMREVIKLILDEMREEGKEIPPESFICQVESPAVVVTV